jgi:hypothetical protein
MKSTKRKRRSDKFPLTLHPTGQYCKKIKGKMRSFGTDKKKALKRYLAQATYLHGVHSLLQNASNGKMTLKLLCDLYLQYQHSRVLADNVTPKHYSDRPCPGWSVMERQFSFHCGSMRTLCFSWTGPAILRGPVRAHGARSNRSSFWHLSDSWPVVVNPF